MSRDSGPWTPSFGIAARIIGNPTYRRVFGGDIPDRDLRWAGIGPDMDVYELGAGSGLYTLPLARALGSGGRLAAGEYWPAGAGILKKRVAKAGLENVVVHVGDGNALPAGPASLDAVCCFYSLEEIPSCENVGSQLVDALKPGGLMVLFLWRPLCRKAKRASLLTSLEHRGMRQVAIWKTLQNVRVVLEKTT